MTKKTEQASSQLAITLVKSISGRLPAHIATVKGLGLSKIRQKVIREDNACIRGMINQVSYLLAVEQIAS